MANNGQDCTTILDYSTTFNYLLVTFVTKVTDHENRAIMVTLMANTCIRKVSAIHNYLLATFVTTVTELCKLSDYGNPNCKYM